MKKIISFLICALAVFGAQATNYLPITYVPGAQTLSVTAVGNGTITSSPAGISCPGTCSAAFSVGASITLTATAASSNASSSVHGTGTELYAWGGAQCTGQSVAGNCTFTFPGSTNAAATFTPKDSDVWWIASAGSDANNGRSRNTPKATLNNVLPLMAAGDTLYFDDGVYNQSLGGNGGAFTTNIVSGTIGKYTRFLGYTRSVCAQSCASGTASATIDGQYNRLSIYVWRTSNIEIGYLRALHSSSGLLNLEGDTNGTGSALTVNCSGGAVSGVTVSTAGTGYPTSSGWIGAIWGGGVTGAQITVNTNGSGAIGSVTVNNAGSGCTAGSTFASADMRVNNIYVHDTGTGQSLPGSSGANIIGMGTNRCQNCVFERNWSWGYGARYPLALYSGVNNVLRQNVTRYDGAPDGQPKAGIVGYDEDFSYIENNITLDFDSGTDSTSDTHSALFTTASATNATYPYGLGTIGWYGNIAMNTIAANSSGGFYFDSHASMFSGPTGSTVPTFTAIDNIVAGMTTPSTGGGMWISHDDQATTRGANHNVVLNRNTIWNSNSNGLRIDNFSFPSITLKNMVINGGTYTTGGCYNQQWVGTPVSAANIWYNCNNALYTALPSSTNVDPAFVWLENVTTGPAFGTGNGGGNIGGTVVNQYQNGTLSGTALWPFPNEALIKDDLCLAPDSGSAATCEVANNKTCSIYTRGHNASGFCASGKSLTKYIWEQLGNTSPY